MSKHILITGASDGIGKELAMQYFNQGDKVSVCGRRLEALKNVYQNTNVFFQSADVSIEDECKQFIKNAITHHGPIDVLINNAGISMRALFENMDLEVLRKVMDINFWGAVYCTKYCLPSVLATKGVVCNISSIAGYRGLPARSGYSASKFALQGFSESLRTELLHSGVHVMWISPGFTASNIRNAALNAEGNSQGETPLKENKLMSAQECASNIRVGIKNRKRTLIMTLQGKMTVLINKLFPSLADKLVYNHFAKEADSPIK
jgi:short-subunit dehydrogenase